jgi:hypothetical protein
MKIIGNLYNLLGTIRKCMQCKEKIKTTDVEEII